MADAKITALDANTTPALTDIVPIVDDPGGSPVTQKIALSNLLFYNPYKARAFLNVDQTGVADATWTTITLGNESYDVNSNFNTGTYTYTVPLTGYYQLCAGARIIGTGATDQVLRIYKNNNTEVCRNYTPVGTSVYTLPLSDVAYLSANDTLVLQAYSDISSGTATVSSGTAVTYMGIHLLSV